MRPPGPSLSALLLLSCLASCFCAAAATCPSQLPQGCACQKSPSAVRVRCGSPAGVGSAQIHEILASVGATPVDRLEIHNVAGVLDGPWPEARIRKLHLLDGNVSDVAKGVFASLGAELVELAVRNCSLRRFPSFGELPKLTSLDLSGNRLEEVREEGLADLRALRRLRLANNSICAMSSAVLNHSKAALELLDLSGNCFPVVPAQNLRNAVNLKFIDLSRNRIAAVNNFELMNLPELRDLRLDSNRVEAISAMGLMNIPQLESLSLRNNSLQLIDSVKLQAFSRLTFLDFGHNRFEHMPSVHDLPRLQRIRMDHNRLSSVATLAFSANPRLEFVDLAANQIVSVARNAFDSIDRLSVLHLADNRVETLYRGMFDGIRNLQHLSLRNNSVATIDANAFDSIRHLVSLDLSANRLSHIAAGTFAPFRGLFWLDLSRNRIETIEKNAFTSKIANLLLHENVLQCDEAFRWLPEYLVLNKVRTFLPYQPDIRCAGPEALANVRLKDIMIQVANATLSYAPSTQAPMLSSLFGALGINPAVLQSAANLPPAPTAVSPQNAQIQQVLQAAPSMIVAVPGIGNVDVSKLSPDIIRYVLQGGQIPGIPKATLDAIVAEYKQKLATSGTVDQAALSIMQIPAANQGTIASPQSVPSQPQSAQLPALPVATLLSQVNGAVLPNSSNPGSLPQLQLPPEAVNMMRLLPPGYDLSKIPVDVVNTIIKGQIPDLSTLPKDLQAHLMTNIDKLLPPLRDAAPNITLEELLAKLPSMERPVLPTFAPYELLDIGNDLIAEEDDGEAARLRLFTAIGLGAVGALSIAILAVFCVSVRRRRRLQNVIVDIDVEECKTIAAPTRPEQLAALGHNSHFSPLRPTTVHPRFH